MPPLETPPRLDALLARARARAGDLGRPVLACMIESLEGLDPLNALAAAAHASRSEPAIASLLASGRMFWAHPAAAHSMTGLGAAATIAPSGAERFEDADQSWRALLDSALVDERDGHSSASGPVLMGGASFEPSGPRSALWEGFGSTGFFVPAVLVTAEQGRCTITASLLVHPDGTTSVRREDLLRLRAVILAQGTERFTAEHDAGDGRAGVDLELTDLRSHREWRGLVRDAVAAIHADDFRKVVLARSLRALAPHPVDVLALLDVLRAAHRDSYVFACWRGSNAFVGASPERLVRLSGREVDASSLAGSAPRGSTPADDASLSAALLASEKDRAEHAIVRTALGEALSRFCDDVRSEDGPSLMTLPNVHHLHTAVHARLRDDHSLLELVGALHPTPAVGGAPREPALAFIRAHEQLDRGWYAAPIGWIGRDAGELAVALRSALVVGAEATLFAGCGIVGASDPDRELAESEVKLRPMQMAIAASFGSEPAVGSAADAAGVAR